KVDIVVGREDCRSEFPGGEQMPKIRSRVAPANGASACWIDGPLVPSMACVLDEHAPFTRVETPMPRGARGTHTVHHGNPECHVIRELFRPTHAHKITRAVAGQ